MSYPELDIYKCLVIPKELREKVSRVWKAPQVYFSSAQEVSGVCVSVISVACQSSEVFSVILYFCEQILIIPLMRIVEYQYFPVLVGV